MHHMGLSLHELVVCLLAYIQQMYWRVFCRSLIFDLDERVAILQQWIWGFVLQRVVFDLEELLGHRLGVYFDGGSLVLVRMSVLVCILSPLLPWLEDFAMGLVVQLPVEWKVFWTMLGWKGCLLRLVFGARGPGVLFAWFWRFDGGLHF